jgi:hypothetical protein
MYINEFAAKVMEGMKRANRKLVETAAANNESLIIGDKKELLKPFPQRKLN